MLNIPQFTLFLTATLVLLIVPGPAVLYIITRSIDQGRLAGIVSTLGVALGTLGHVLAAALGLSALLLKSALAFNVVKYLGAAYLIYLGIQKFREKGDVQIKGAGQPEPLSRVFSQGVIVNLLNPKTALFFFAFLPQFVDTSRGSIATQIMTLGIVFVVMGIVSDGLYALLAGTLGGWLKENLQFIRAQRYFAGTVYIALGITTALSSGGRK